MFPLGALHILLEQVIPAMQFKLSTYIHAICQGSVTYCNAHVIVWTSRKAKIHTIQMCEQQTQQPNECSMISSSEGKRTTGQPSAGYFSNSEHGQPLSLVMCRNSSGFIFGPKKSSQKRKGAEEKWVAPSAAGQPHPPGYPRRWESFCGKILWLFVCWQCSTSLPPTRVTFAKKRSTRLTRIFWKHHNFHKLTSAFVSTATLLKNKKR